MRVPNQDDLAWELLDATRPSLDIATINRVSMTMANRDYATVIELLLGAAVKSSLHLPFSLHQWLTEWARYRDGHPRQDALQRLLARVATE